MVDRNGAAFVRDRVGLDGCADTVFTDTASRVRAFADPGSFTEFGSRARHRTNAFGMQHKRPAGDGVVTGIGRVDGREVAVFAQDPTALGGSLGEVHASKIARIVAYAGRARNPVVGLIDSDGARIQEGVAALDGYGAIFRANVALSGRVPQLGPCAGGATYADGCRRLRGSLHRHRPGDHGRVRVRQAASW